MTLELNKPYFVKRVANRDGVLHFLPIEGFCYGIELNKPHFAKRVANKDGVLHYLIADQKLNTDGTLILNKPYFAKRVANKDGVLHYLINGKQCEGGGFEILCDIEFTPTGTIGTAVHSGGLPSGMEPMFDTWTGLSLQTGQELLSDVSFDNYDFSVVYIDTTFGAPPFFTHGLTYQQPTIFGVCSSNVTAAAESFGYQTPWTAFNSGALQFKHVYLVSKLVRTVIAPPTTFESCVYQFMTFVREAEGEPTECWYVHWPLGTQQTNTWCDSGTPKISNLVFHEQGSGCGSHPAGVAFGVTGRPATGGIDIGPCMAWAAGPS